MAGLKMFCAYTIENYSNIKRKEPCHIGKTNIACFYSFVIVKRVKGGRTNSEMVDNDCQNTPSEVK
jgi:hypothetical protein